MNKLFFITLVILGFGLFFVSCQNNMNPYEESPTTNSAFLSKTDGSNSVVEESNFVVEECETAFAYGCKDFTKCFLEDGFNRWGWTTGPLGPGGWWFDIYAGAGQCDKTKGTLVGYVTVDYDGSTAIVNYKMYSGYSLDEVHLYIGSEPFPRLKNGKYTVAPGQYPYKGSDSYEITGLSGGIWVIAHAVVCVNP